MPGDRPKRIYWDSSVFLAWISREQVDDRVGVVRGLLEDARKGEMEIVTSVLTITEVAFAAQEKQARFASDAALGDIDKLWRHPAIKLAGFHRLIAVSARDLIRRAMAEHLSLQAPDAIHLSTASRSRCRGILTYDPKWAAYANLVGLPISEPTVGQGTLDFKEGSA